MIPPPITHALSLPELEQATDENLIVHSGWLPSQREEMWVQNDGSLLLVDTLLNCDTFNVVSAARLKPETAREQIEGVLQYFERANRAFTWWTGPADSPSHLRELLTDAGLEQGGVDVAMRLELQDLKEPPLVPSVQIERVRSSQQLSDFANIVAQNWNPPDQELLRFYQIVSEVLLREEAPLWLYVASVEGVPVATSQLTFGGGIVGVYNVCTLVPFRRRGIASALLGASLKDARESGYHHAILQASREGFGVYERLGFYETGAYVEYKPPARSR